MSNELDKSKTIFSNKIIDIHISEKYYLNITKIKLETNNEELIIFT